MYRKPGEQQLTRIKVGVRTPVVAVVEVSTKLLISQGGVEQDGKQPKTKKEREIERSLIALKVWNDRETKTAGDGE
eukprot:4431326-Alexandrium_andersonii.AAC.1